MTYDVHSSPYREQNDMHAVNRMCERFCVCASHACLLAIKLIRHHNKISQEQLNFFQNLLYLYKRMEFNI